LPIANCRFANGEASCYFHAAIDIKENRQLALKKIGNWQLEIGNDN
jgi:hypothetical protein